VVRVNRGSWFVLQGVRGYKVFVVTRCSVFVLQGICVTRHSCYKVFVVRACCSRYVCSVFVFVVRTCVPCAERVSLALSVCPLR
jgi:hypothetical protein